LRSLQSPAHAALTPPRQVSPRVWFMRQTVGNACGTVGLLHACANNADAIPPAPASFLARFLANTAGMDAGARATALAEDDSLDAAHAAAAEQGQTAAPGADDEVNLHFVAFIHADGGLYELDGRKPCAVRHGDTSEATLLADAVAVVQSEFLPHAGGDVHFNVIALAPAQED
jgi:ubiquitin carboxyl-terminal hydrolase L3